MLHTFAIFKASTSIKKGEIPFSPTTFMAVPKASAEASRTEGSKRLENNYTKSYIFIFN